MKKIKLIWFTPNKAHLVIFIISAIPYCSLNHSFDKYTKLAGNSLVWFYTIIRKGTFCILMNDF